MTSRHIRWMGSRCHARQATAVLLLLTACGARHSEPDPDPEPEQEPALLRPPPFEAPECAATAVTTRCADDPSVVSCRGIAGYDFLQAWVGWNHLDTVANLSVPEPGTVCIGGTLVASKTYVAGVTLGFALSPRDDGQTCVLEAFDAHALDIAAIQFDLSEMPEARMTFGVEVLTQSQCDDTVQCTEGGYYSWLTPDQQEVAALHAGTNRVPLDELIGDDLLDPVSARWISDFGVGLDNSLIDLPYQYCLSNIQLLDSAGNVVLPAPER